MAVILKSQVKALAVQKLQRFISCSMKPGRDRVQVMLCENGGLIGRENCLPLFHTLVPQLSYKLSLVYHRLFSMIKKGGKTMEPRNLSFLLCVKQTDS